MTLNQAQRLIAILSSRQPETIPPSWTWINRLAWDACMFIWHARREQRSVCETLPGDRDMPSPLSPGSHDREELMLTQTNSQQHLDRSLVMDGIARICAEWAEATANSGDLLEETTEGLLIADIAEATGLTIDEVAMVMGRAR